MSAITHPADATLGDPLYASRKEGWRRLLEENLQIKGLIFNSLFTVYGREGGRAKQ
jgi:hypothetical protein